MPASEHKDLIKKAFTANADVTLGASWRGCSDSEFADQSSVMIFNQR